MHVLEFSPKSDPRKRAEEEVARAARDLHQEDRPSVTLGHDARTLAWMMEQEGVADVSSIFCTWDGLHHHLRRAGAHNIDVFDPMTLGDLLSLAAPASRNSDEVFGSPAFVAQAMTEETAQQGARVWDRLAAIEKGNLSDASLRAKARRFKEDWLQQKSRDRSREESLPAAWARWRQK